MESNVNLDFEALTQGLPTKSEKIRTLGRAGASTGAIARFLGIRYQFARNVLVDAGLRGSQEKVAPPVHAGGEVVATGSPNNAKGQEGSGAEGVWLKVAADGSVRLPEGLLAAAELKPGLQVHARLNGATIELFSQKEALRRAQEIVSRYVPPGVSLVDELIAERRAEVIREDAAT